MLNKLLAFITILLTTLFATACESDSDSNDADAQLRCEQSDAEQCDEELAGETAGTEQEEPDGGQDVVEGGQIPPESCQGEDSEELGCVEPPVEAGTEVNCPPEFEEEGRCNEPQPASACEPNENLDESEE